MRKLNYVLLGLFTIQISVFSQSQDFNNGNLENVNALWINDPGPEEGIKWLGTSSNWNIDVSPEDRSNMDGNLNIYGTANRILLWRPTVIKGSTAYLFLSNTSALLDNKNWYFVAGSDGNFGLSTANDNYGWTKSIIKFKRDGNVGIGVNDPLAKLSVDGYIKVQGNDGRLMLQNPSATGSIYFRNNGSAGQRKLEIMYATNVKAVLDNNGNFGIGTNNPKGILHTKSGAYIYNSTNSAYDANLIIEATSSSREIGKGAALGFVVPANTDGSNPWQQGRILVTPDNTGNSNACGRMYIQTRYLSSGAWHWNNNIVLTSSGNVGIGTTDPKAKLSVNGTIISEEIKVLADISQYPDFVFSDNYNLRSIKEVENYIKENKHLPEIPKADEVKEGIALGEMNTKLLQKIEELTLYIIEQSKEIEKLKERLDQNGIE